MDSGDAAAGGGEKHQPHRPGDEGEKLRGDRDTGQCWGERVGGVSTHPDHLRSSGKKIQDSGAYRVVEIHVNQFTGQSGGTIVLNAELRSMNSNVTQTPPLLLWWAVPGRWRHPRVSLGSKEVQEV